MCRQKNSPLRGVVLFLVSLVPCTVVGQNYTISTFAGSAQQVNIPGTSAVLGPPSAVAVDAVGNLFFTTGNVVLRLDAVTGVLTLVAGDSTTGFSGDNGPAASAQLSSPSGVAVDSAGNIYIADSGNGRIRKVSKGTITTVAGSGNQFGSLGDNGPATSASLHTPAGIAVDSAGNLYIADTNNSRIRKLSNGIITTVAGSSSAGFAGDFGTATLAELNYPNGIALDSTGNLYIADTYNNRIRKVSASGIITTVAGNGTFSFGGDGRTATSAQLAEPSGISVDTAGNLYIADTFNNRIRKVVSSGIITTIAGTGTAGASGDNGPAISAQVAVPITVALDPAGNVYFSDLTTSQIRKISGNGTISTVAGNTKYGYSGDGGPAINAQFNSVAGVNLDVAGNIYITEQENCRIRKVSGGIVTTVAGNGTCGFGGDNGPATSALLNSPFGSNAVDSAGNLYIADSSNNRIRKVSNGVITTVAGTGRAGFAGDNGQATSAQLYFPTGVAVDSAGSFYIADQQNHRVRKVTNGIITTVAGNGLLSGVGDSGPATSAELGYPSGVAVDSTGNLYIADSVVRKVSNGVITTVAGPGTFGVLGDNGLATSAYLVGATGVAVDSAGNLYIADGFDYRIRKVSNGIIATIGGSGSSGFGGDNGPATGALLGVPRSVAVDANGNVYVADGNNNRVRLLTPSTAPSCTYSLTPPSLNVSPAGGNFSVNVQTDASCLWTVSGLDGFVTLSGPSSGSGSATITLVVAPNLSPPSLVETVTIAGVSLTITQAGNTGVMPSITAAGVTNAASFQTGLVPGEIITIFGTNLGASAGSIAFGNWGTKVGGTSVTINGATAPAYILLNQNGQEQLSVQVPWSLSGVTSAAVAVTTTNGTSPSVTVPVLSAQPGIFLLDTASSGATHLNGTIAGASNPVSRGESVVLYLTGMGTVTNQPATGTGASLITLSSTIVTPTVTIGSVNAPVSFSGLAPSFIGLYQINASIPASAQSGLLDLKVSMNGVTNNTAKIAVQ